MEKEEQIAKCAINYINPYYANIFTNVNGKIQDAIVKALPKEFSISMTSENERTSKILIYDGIQIFKDLSMLVKSLKIWAVKNGIVYTEGEELYRLFQKDILTLGTQTLNLRSNEMQQIEHLRNVDQLKYLSKLVVETYFFGIIYPKMYEKDETIEKISRFYASKDLLAKAIKTKKQLLSGDFSEFENNMGYLDLHTLETLTSSMLSQKNIGYFNLIKNGQYLIDRDIINLLNSIISFRSSAFSMSIITSLDSLYSYSTGTGHVNEETHDLHTINVKRLIK